MEDINRCIGCDVAACKYNAMGRNCTLGKIKVTQDCRDGTCCGSFEHSI